MMRTNRLATLLLALGLALGTACGRDHADVIPVLAEGESRVDLVPLDLAGHAGFDLLDQFIQTNGAAGEAMQIYEDLSRLAPDNRLVLLRAAHAALIMDQSDAAPRLASSILERLRGDAAEAADAPDLDVLFVDLIRITRLLAAGAQADTLVITEAGAPMARQALEHGEALANATGWKGPHGATAADAKRMLDAIAAALRDFEARGTDAP